MSNRIKIVFGILLLIAGFVVVRVSILARNGLSQTASIYTGRTDRLNSLTALAPKDQDKDGLPDADEILFGTDPFNSDSDSDGYLDGAEITSGYNPLDKDSNTKSGPSDLKYSKPNLTANAVNFVAASLFDEIGSLDPSKANDFTASDITRNLLTQASIILYSEPVQDSALHIIDDNSPETIKHYLRVITPLIQNDIFNKNLLISMSGSNENIKKALEGYQRAVQQLLATEVPSSWSKPHKNFINISREIIQSGQFLTGDQIDEDPVKAIFALQQFQNSLLSLGNLLNQTVSLAKSQNISTEDFNILSN